MRYPHCGANMCGSFRIESNNKMSFSHKLKLNRYKITIPMCNSQWGKCVCAHSLYLSTAHLLWMRNRARGWHFRHAYVVKEFVFAADKNATSINMLKAFSRLYIATLFNYKTRQTFDFKVNSPPANFSCIRWNRIFFRSFSLTLSSPIRLHLLTFNITCNATE